jgi:tRNA dimethylallyltransferase
MMTGAAHRLPVICIMGPTASGKTDLAVELVKRFPFSVVSVDSALVYRQMNIGTAKPDAEILRIAPHRLIDILDPAQAYSAARFCADAVREMNAIWAAGRVPVLTGGTMLYFRALQRGLSVLPPADADVRNRLETEREHAGSEALHARLAAVDAVAAARIHPRDFQRIQRALEVYELTGRTLTELCSPRPDKLGSFSMLKLVLAPDCREVLHARIERRFYAMLEQGFVAEVEALRARGDLTLDKPAMRAVGYRQIWEYLDGLTDYEDMVQRGLAATRQFAKRQLTWLRSEPDTVWLDKVSSRRIDGAIEHLRKGGFLPESH